MDSAVPWVQARVRVEVAYPTQEEFLGACHALLHGNPIHVGCRPGFPVGSWVRVWLSHPGMEHALAVTLDVQECTPLADSEDFAVELALPSTAQRTRDILAELVKPPPAAPAPASPAGPRTHHVLLVEDNPHISQMFAHALRRAITPKEGPVTVHRAENGVEALRRLRQKPPVDLVLSDLHMPVMDGFMLLEQVKSDPALAATPVLVISAGDEGDMARASALGAAGHLHKPVQLQHIVEQVRRILGYPSAQ